MEYVLSSHKGVYIKWYIEISWGSDNGKEGYLVMTDD